MQGWRMAERFRDAPVRRKLLFVGLLTSGCALLFISLILAVKDVAEWRARAVSDLAAHAGVVGASVAPAMMFDDTRAAAETLSALSAKPDIIYAVVFDSEGKEFAAYRAPGHRQQSSHLPGATAHRFTFDSLTVSSPVRYQGEPLGSLSLESDLGDLYAGVARSIGLIFAAAFIAFAVAAWGFSRLLRIIVKPVTDMAGAMQDVVAKQDFAVRVGQHGKDEIGTLANAFNIMLEYIQSRDAELARHRANLEEEVAERAASLLEAQRIARLGNWEWDIADGTLVWSDEVYRIFGLAPQEFTGSYEAFLQFVHPEDRQLVEDSVREALVSAHPYSIDHRIVRPDGSVRYVHEQAEMLRNGSGRSIGMHGTVQDITERKQAEEEIRRSNADLEQFAYAASHDMRQPLRMITSYLQLIEADLAPVLDDGMRQNFQFATEGAKRMDQMLTALLDYSRVGRKADAMAAVDSREIVDEALRYLEPAIGEARAAVRVEGEWPHLFASRDELLRLFQNLIDNALKYRVPDREPEIAVSARVADGEWRFEVRDNGVGLLPGQEARLFKVFERLQPRSRYPGTGIGLALCRKIVEHHKGRIWVESPGEDQGCTFVVALPALLPPPVAGGGGALNDANRRGA